MKIFTQKAFIRHAFKMHALIMQTLQATLLSKLAMICLLLTASGLTFIGCAPVMDPVSKKAGDGKIADGGTPTPDDTPDPVVDPPAPAGPPALVGPIYVAVGDGGKIALSKDSGSSWQAVASGTTENLWDTATDGTNIVAVANTGAVVRSTNGGDNWSVISSTGISSSSTENSFAEIEYGDGVFTLFAAGGTPLYAFYRSTDGGATWATGTITSGLFTAAVTTKLNLAYDGSRFLAVGGFNDEGTIAVSTDGLAYTSGLGNGDIKFGSRLVSLRIANGRFFIVTSFSTSFHGFQTPNIYQAPTGTWGASPWTTNRSASATDVTIFPATASDMQISDIAHSGSGGVYAFVGTGFNVTIMTSPTAMDGSFTGQTSPILLGLTRIIFFKGKFVVAGSNGIIFNGNPAGTTWTVATSGTTELLSIGEATANKIVFAGDNGAIVVSSDGTTWEAKSATGNDTRYRRLVLIE